MQDDRLKDCAPGRSEYGSLRALLPDVPSGQPSGHMDTPRTLPLVARVSRKAIFPALLVALVLVAAGCAQISTPKGWSGGVISGDALIIGTEDGTVLAVDKIEGTTLWVQGLRGEPEVDRAVYGTPAVAGDNVFVGGYDSILYAYNTEGQEIWQEPLGGRIVGGPAVVGDLVIAGVALDDAEGGRQGRLYAFEADTGDSVWSFPTDGPIWSAPAVSAGTVYFGTLGKVIFAVSVDNGQEVWRFETGGAVVASPLIMGGRVYVGDFDSVFYALNAQTGAFVWRFDGAARWYWAKAIAHKGTIYAPSLDGNLYALDAASGRMLWKYETEGAIVGSPVILGDRIIVPVADGDDSKISILELNGSFSAACKIGEDVRTPLVADGDLIYFGVADHSIRALRIKSSGNPDEEWVYFTDREDPIPRERAKAC